MAHKSLRKILNEKVRILIRPRTFDKIVAYMVEPEDNEDEGINLSDP
jgi:hypothetical protein